MIMIIKCLGTKWNLGEACERRGGELFLNPKNRLQMASNKNERQKNNGSAKNENDSRRYNVNNMVICFHSNIECAWISCLVMPHLINKCYARSPLITYLLSACSALWWSYWELHCDYVVDVDGSEFSRRKDV
jgi:hypothetical protein